MILNYLRISLRYLLKNRTFSAINVFGLTLGFICFILIVLYLHDELSFDMFHRDAARIYRVLQHEKKEDGTIRNVVPVAAQIGIEAPKSIPEVEDALRFTAFGRITMGNDPPSRDYEGMLSMDPNIFSFFDFELVSGDPVNVLQQPDGIVISEAWEKKYFGNEPAIGKRLWSTLNRDDKPLEFTVTGVMKEFPKNSHLQFNMLFAPATWPTVFTTYSDFEATDWTSNFYVTYLKLKPGADPAAVAEKLTQITKSHYPADKVFNSTFSLQALKDVHLFSEGLQGTDGRSTGIKPLYLYLFAVVGFLILLIACLNYMNLTTAAAYKRTREIGTRKTLGAQKRQLIFQFTGEAILLSLTSLVIAIVLIQAVLPAVNEFTEKNMKLESLPTNWILLITLAMTASGILSSFYPAFVISRIRPSDALKKDVRLGNHSLPVRKLLVSGQFAISIMMIASTLVIYKQLNYLQTKDLGFDLTGKLVIDINSGLLRNNFENVKEEFSKVPEVQSISTSTRVPGEWKSFPVATVRTDGAPTGHEMIFVGIDHDFLKTYNIKLVEGRNFTSIRADSMKVILTKMAVRELGLSNPVGKTVEIPSLRFGGSAQTLKQPFRVEVIGIAEDFHFESFRKEMMPLIFGAGNTVIQRIDYYTLNIKTSNWSETIEKLKAVNTSIDADNPMEYTFLDDRFEEFYKADEKRGQIFLTFSLVIVLIACLGLFALVSYSIESRTKEIGIRKVLGASVENIVAMVSREFGVLVGVAGVVAIPAAWYLTERWLADFAYRVSAGPEIFALAVLLALLIAFLTISVRTIRAAAANPVNSLRSE